MFTITKEFTFDMGHRVPNHKSKCMNLHGHTYRIQLTLQGETIKEEGSSDEGMVMDFSDIKTIAKGYIDLMLDHGCMFYEKDEIMCNLYEGSAKDWKHMKVSFIPTAENIAKYLFYILSPMFEDKYGTGLTLSNVRLWETPTSFADYSGLQKISMDCLLTDEELNKLKEDLEGWKGKISPCSCSCSKLNNPFEVRPLKQLTPCVSAQNLEVGAKEESPRVEITPTVPPSSDNQETDIVQNNVA